MDWELFLFGIWIGTKGIGQSVVCSGVVFGGCCTEEQFSGTIVWLFWLFVICLVRLGLLWAPSLRSDEVMFCLSWKSVFIAEFHHILRILFLGLVSFLFRPAYFLMVLKISLMMKLDVSRFFLVLNSAHRFVILFRACCVFLNLGAR